MQTLINSFFIGNLFISIILNGVLMFLFYFFWKLRFSKEISIFALKKVSFLFDNELSYEKDIKKGLIFIQKDFQKELSFSTLLFAFPVLGLTWIIATFVMQNIYSHFSISSENLTFGIISIVIYSIQLLFLSFIYIDYLKILLNLKKAIEKFNLLNEFNHKFKDTPRKEIKRCSIENRNSFLYSFSWLNNKVKSPNKKSSFDLAIQDADFLYFKYKSWTVTKSIYYIVYKYSDDKSNLFYRDNHSDMYEVFLRINDKLTSENK